MHKTINILIVLLNLVSSIFAQETKEYALSEIVKIAITKSPDYQRIKTIKENSYWEWKYYKALYKPKLTLQGIIPAFENNNIPIYTNDGSIEYRKVNQSSSRLNLNIEQALSFTGGTLFLSSDLSRIDNFQTNVTGYSGSPVYLGLEQPIFGHNSLKWMNRIEPLKYDEELKKYVENLEVISVQTTNLFFNLLLAQINMEISNNNLQSTSKLLVVGEDRFKIGRISKNELLQLQFSVISAKKALAMAQLQQETSLLNLKSYLGVEGDFGLLVPENIPFFAINTEKALEFALENNYRMLNYKRQIIEAERDEDKARKEAGTNAMLSVAVGLNNISDNVPGIYQNPGEMQTVNLSIRVPILDWGRKKAVHQMALANKRLVESTVKQDEINFSQSVITEVKNYKMYSDYIKFAIDADKTASERFNIAQERYVASDISLTELNISQQEKDVAKQDHINALKGFWMTFYNIRAMTLYDFEKDKALIQIN